MKAILGGRINPLNPPVADYSQPGPYQANPYAENASYVPTSDYYVALQPQIPNTVNVLPPASKSPTITPPIYQNLTPTGPDIVVKEPGACFGNGDCPEGTVCNNGVCVEIIPPQPLPRLSETGKPLPTATNDNNDWIFIGIGIAIMAAIILWVLYGKRH